MSQSTKRRILDATLETLRTHGAAGTSARAIAKAGGFNTSLLFYHFGSIEGALVAAAKLDTGARVKRYGQRLEQVTSLQELVAFSREMHQENITAGHVTVLVQMLASTSAHPDIREELATIFDPWIDLVRQTLDRLLGPDGLAGIGTTTDIAVGVTSLFLGLELLTHLGDDGERAASLLDTVGEAADLLVALGALTASGPEQLAGTLGGADRPRPAPRDQLADLPGQTGHPRRPAGTPPPGN
ncbi:MAG: TetR/AcrR family transcriptional regulator [Euzebya sp.]